MTLRDKIIALLAESERINAVAICDALSESWNRVWPELQKLVHEGKLTEYKYPNKGYEYEAKK
jgi:hypothetical protein